MAKINRVSDDLKKVVLEFRSLFHDGEVWHDSDLADFIRDSGYIIAPASPSRILRDMRAQGLLNYEVVHRRQSLYRFIPIIKELVNETA